MLLALIDLFERDILKVINELNSYPDDSMLWTLDGEINNRPGNLAIHIAGNLRHFIGANLGNTAYIRDRPHEFNARNIPKVQIIKDLNESLEIVKSTLKQLKESDLKKTYPIQVFGYPMTIQYFLIHLHGHLNYHLGQINYHRRILSFQ